MPQPAFLVDSGSINLGPPAYMAITSVPAPSHGPFDFLNLEKKYKVMESAKIFEKL